MIEIYNSVEKIVSLCHVSYIKDELYLSFYCKK
jgi:hypothetical protein